MATRIMKQRNQDDDEFAERNNIVIETPVATFTATNSIIPFERYGEQSPVLACDDVEMTFTFAFAKSIDAIAKISESVCSIFSLLLRLLQKQNTHKK